MFERFTGEARQAIVNAQQEARRLHHSWVGTEHILLGLLTNSKSLSATALREHGVDRTGAESAIMRSLPRSDIDAEALEVIGIDIDAVRDRVEAAFGPGALDSPPATHGRARSAHLPVSRRARKSLELALREALRLGHRHIADGHVLLGVLREGTGRACQVLQDAGVDFDDLRKDVEAALR